MNVARVLFKILVIITALVVQWIAVLTHSEPSNKVIFSWLLTFLIIYVAGLFNGNRDY